MITNRRTFLTNHFLHLLDTEHPDITDTRPMVERLNQLMDGFERLDHPTRKNFLNLTFVIRKILQEQGFTTEFVSPFSPGYGNTERHEELYALIKD